MTTTQADMPDDDLRFHHVKAMVLIHVDETGTCPSLEDTLCALAKRHIPMERQRVSSTLDQIVSSAEFSERLRGAEERVLFPRALQQLRTLSEDLCGARAVTVVELASAVGTTAMVVDEALRRKAAKLHITIPELLDRERQLGERLCRNRSEFEDLRKAITWPNIRRWVGFRGLTSSELTSAANLGFEHALRHYRRSESGFTRYASRVVRNAVYREVNPISPSLLALLRDIAAATHELMQRLEHRPTLDEIATELSTTDRVVTREQIEEALKAYRLAWADQPPEGDDEDDSDTEAIARIAWASGMTREPENALPGELPAFIALVLDVLGADQVRLLLATPATMTGAERRRLHRARLEFYRVYLGRVGDEHPAVLDLPIRYRVGAYQETPVDRHLQMMQAFLERLERDHLDVHFFEQAERRILHLRYVELELVDRVAERCQLPLPGCLAREYAAMMPIVDALTLEKRQGGRAAELEAALLPRQAVALVEAVKALDPPPAPPSDLHAGLDIIWELLQRERYTNTGRYRIVPSGDAESFNDAHARRWANLDEVRTLLSGITSTWSIVA